MGDGERKVEPQQGQSASDDNTPAADPITSPKEPSTPLGSQPLLEAPKSVATPNSSGWLGGWLGRPALQTPTVPDEPHHPELISSPNPEPQPESQPEPQEQSKETIQPARPASSSWFGLWSSSTPAAPEEAESKDQIPVKVGEDNQDITMEEAPAPDQPSKSPSPPVAGSSWAFWSTDTSSKKGNGSLGKTEDSGQLAVTGEASQDHPEPAITTPLKDSKKTKSSKRSRPKSIELDEASRKIVEAEPTASQVDLHKTSTPAKQTPPNLLMPSVRSTYRLVENPSILRQIARLVFRGNQQPVKHVYLVKERPKIKSALAIGIHGLFPAPLLRTVIGQPTGTSIRFANHAAASIRRWADKTGSTDCEIEKIALEGEGKIGERVDNLWKLLLNWVGKIKHADFILVACHSQGVPVALMLIAKLIEFGVVSGARIGVCAMGELFSKFSHKLVLQSAFTWGSGTLK